MKEDLYSSGADKQTSVVAPEIFVWVVTLLDPLDNGCSRVRGTQLPGGSIFDACYLLIILVFYDNFLNHCLYMLKILDFQIVNHGVYIVQDQLQLDF